MTKTKTTARRVSTVARPGRWHASRSAWRIQRRKVSVVQPIFLAIERMAAHSVSCASRCSPPDQAHGPLRDLLALRRGHATRCRLGFRHAPNRSNGGALETRGGSKQPYAVRSAPTAQAN